MKPVFLVSLCGCLLLPLASAYAGKSCVELRDEIDNKLKSSGVQNYVLGIVPKEQVQDGKIIGVCEGATKKITYSRTAIAEDKAAEDKAAEDKTADAG